MKASTLLRHALASSSFSSVYTAHYGAAANPGHEAAIRKTVAELADDLDAGSVEVHQEGFLAGYQAAQAAPEYGRPTPAVEARRKTLEFCVVLVRDQVARQRAHTFSIPGATFQGAGVMTARATAALNRYGQAHAAFVASPTEEAKGNAGRAASMLTTAIAEAVAAQRATSAPGVYLTPKELDSLPPGDPYLIIGVEVPASMPQLYARCHMVIDPQHGGGVRGFGSVTITGKCAATAALDIVESGWRCPPLVRFVSPRWDADAAVAAWILQFGAPFVGILRDASVGGGCGCPAEALLELERLDSPVTVPGTWTPGQYFTPVGESNEWGGLSRLLFAARTPEALAETIYLVPFTLGLINGRSEALEKASEEADKAARAANNSARNGTLVQGVYVLGDHRLMGGTRIAYREAPVVLMRNPEFRSPNWTGQKYTIMVHPGASQEIHAGISRCKAELTALEPGWGGTDMVIGSPFAGPSKLTLDQVQGVVIRCLGHHANGRTTTVAGASFPALS